MKLRNLIKWWPTWHDVHFIATLIWLFDKKKQNFIKQPFYYTLPYVWVDLKFSPILEIRIRIIRQKSFDNIILMKWTDSNFDKVTLKLNILMFWKMSFFSACRIRSSNILSIPNFFQQLILPKYIIIQMKTNCHKLR
jgi:hypothetical protein